MAQVECSRGVKLVADVQIGDVANSTFDAIAIPVGMWSDLRKPHAGWLPMPFTGH